FRTGYKVTVSLTFMAMGQPRFAASIQGAAASCILHASTCARSLLMKSDMRVQRSDQPTGATLNVRDTRRDCGTCTACCDGWLQIEVRGHQVRPGKPCPFRVDHGCSIYGERPQHPCREFVCGWLVASSPLPDWMRPDKSDLIMLAANFDWRS